MYLSFVCDKRSVQVVKSTRKWWHKKAGAAEFQLALGFKDWTLRVVIALRKPSPPEPPMLSGDLGKEFPEKEAFPPITFLNLS